LRRWRAKNLTSTNLNPVRTNQNDDLPIHIIHSTMSFAKNSSMDPPPLARAYAVVPTSADDDAQHLVQHITPTTVVRFDDEEDTVGDAAYRLYRNSSNNKVGANLSAAAYRTVNPTLYGHLPEAAHLSWEDDYFDDDEQAVHDENVVAVFDLDYDAMERYWERVSWTSMGASMLLLPHVAWIALLGLAPCYLRQNVRWTIRAQHVAITRDGIRFVRERRPTCWGSACTDAGRSTKTIPFDHITDCSIEEPAGNTCLWIPNTLHTVQIDTASSERSQHELTIVGLKDPVAFKRLVWAMKRHYHPGRPDPMATAATAAAAPASAVAVSNNNSSNNAAMERALTSLASASSSPSGDDPTVVAALLREIRDELRHNNDALRGLSRSGGVPPSAPASDLDNYDKRS
jgi:hypothetical protein